MSLACGKVNWVIRKDNSAIAQRTKSRVRVRERKEETGGRGSREG